MDAAYDHPDIAIIPSVASSPRGRRAWLGGAIGPLQSAAGALAATPVSRRPHADGARRPLEPCYPNNPWTQQQVTRGVCRDPGTPKYGDVVAETAWCATPPPRRSPAVNSAAGHGVADTPVGAFDASASRSDLSPRTATATPLAGRRNDPYDRCSQQAEEAPHYNLDSIRLAAPRHFLLPRYSFSPRASLPTLADLSPVEAPPTAVPAKAPTERVCADGEGENTVPASLIVTVNFLRRQDAYIADSNSMANIRLGDHVIVDGDAGLDCGKVLAVKLPRAGRCESSVPSKRVHRRATPREIREFQQGCQAAAAALPRIRAIVSRAEGAVENSARVEACEFQFDRAKLFVYYTAEPGFKFSYALTPLFQAFGCRIWMSRIVPERFQRQQETSDNGSKK